MIPDYTNKGECIEINKWNKRRNKQDSHVPRHISTNWPNVCLFAVTLSVQGNYLSASAFVF